MELTAAEKEMIRLKRIEDNAKEEQDKLKAQLAYDKLLRSQHDYIEQDILNHKNHNKRTEDFLAKLAEEGVKEHVTLKSQKIKIEYYNHAKGEIKPEDWRVEHVDKYFINTQWGDLFIGVDMKVTLPYSLTSRYQSYTVKSTASKIKEKLKENTKKQQHKDKISAAKYKLTQEWSKKYPGSEFKYEEKYNNPNYRGGKPYYTHYITITFPNKSWIKVYYYEDGSWGLQEKFDSKYIKPETKEGWFDYLAKE